MPRLSPEDLATKLADAIAQVTIGGKYRHYKNPEHHYTVIDIGFIEDSEEVCVIYRAEYDTHTTWVRTLSDFTSTVEWNG